MRTYLGLFFLSALFALLITPLVGVWGRRLKAFGRRDHHGPGQPVPRLGGLAIVLASFAALAALLAVPNEVRARLLIEWPGWAALLVPASLVLLLGIYDDLAGATPWQKMAVQALAASIVWWLGFRIVSLPLLGYGIETPLVSYLLTVAWIIVVTNAFNLIDGMDGLAAGIAFFVTLSVFVVSLIQGNHFVCILAITLAGSLLGFLRYNSAPAAIFLGDTGSLFLGFFLGTLAIHTSQKSSTLLAIVVPFVAFGLPLLDTGLAVVRRFLSGKPIFAADRNHTHDRLLRNGLSPRMAVLGLYALAALFSLGSLLIIRSTGNLVALVVVLLGVLAWFLTSQLQYEELTELNLYVSGAIHTQRRVLANQILIRKTARDVAEARSLEESWRLLTGAWEALDFAAAECRLSAWENDAAPRIESFRLDWRSPSVPNGAHAPGADHYWSVEIPLRSGGNVLGRLVLHRALDKGRLLFQFSSIAETLVPVFEKQLERSQSGKTKPAIRYSVLVERAPANLLAGDRKQG